VSDAGKIGCCKIFGVANDIHLLRYFEYRGFTFICFEFFELGFAMQNIDINYPMYGQKF